MTPSTGQVQKFDSDFFTIDQIPLAINFHVWPDCNYHCRFCFAQFKKSERRLPRKQALKLIEYFYEWGVQKINFAGGEPTICPYLGELLDFSKNLGLTTSIISNGTGITEKFLLKHFRSIDWLGLSVDSGNEIIQARLGRGNGSHVGSIIKKVEIVKRFPINLKINTVVTALNWRENMGWLINLLRPQRWKVFQILPIENENRGGISELLISNTKFREFIRRHRKYHPIAEDNDLMLESYAMVDPLGRFFQNSGNFYNFSVPILKVGIAAAFKQIQWNKGKFAKRGGFYDWKIKSQKTHLNFGGTEQKGGSND